MYNLAHLNATTCASQAQRCFTSLLEPALLKAHHTGPLWTVLQMVQSALPAFFDCFGERHLISKSEMVRIDFNRDLLQSSFTEIVTSVLDKKGTEEAVKFFNMLQPLLKEILFLEGYSVGLNDFDIPKVVTEDIKKKIQDISPLLLHLRSNYNELVELLVESYLKTIKLPIVTRILKLSTLGNLIDFKNDLDISKVVQQLGFLGLQLYDRGKFYSRRLVEDMSFHFQNKYSVNVDYPSKAFGLVKSSFFQGLTPYEELVHSISSREVLIRSSRGLTEPGTLFKNLMATLRDVVICYDGTVRNLCNNSIIQFEYGQVNKNSPGRSLAGEPDGVLAATAVSNPAYKAVLDSSQSNNSSWESMKEILLCKVNFKNDIIDRRVILYLNECFYGKMHCKENAAYLVQNRLKKVALKASTNT
ncbi:DNA-directed RNA polymerase V subunit 1-like [Magnolia sinica]|uniref:DNA-directed RNA polymerase V subunit 1-like n=1 Tax=Magnolia sinica TaxID=86752 RepID=UPI00265B61AD|nr:DNA-directed RNA polymerase V subunit 1-like [Magnolia sinica]